VLPFHGFHSRHRVRFQHICRRDGAQISAVRRCEIQRGLPLQGQLRISGNFDSLLRHQLGIAAKIANAIHRSGNAKTGYCLKIFSFPNGKARCLFQNSRSKGVLRPLFQSCRHRKQIAAPGKNIRHHGLAGGQRAGLIQHHGIDLMQMLQGSSVFEQYAHRCALSRAHHNGHRGSQAQGAGAGNDQHRNGRSERVLQTAVGKHPNSKRNSRNSHDNRHENTGDLIRQPGNGRFGAAGIFYHTDDLLQGGVLAYLVGPDLQVARHIDRGRRYRIPRLFLYRDAFAGEGTLVHRCPAFQNRSVNRNPATGADDDDIPDLHLFRRNGHFHTVPQHHSRFRPQIHQSTDGVAGLALGSRLQEFTKGDERKDHSRRLKIQILAVKRYGLHIAMTHSIGHAKKRRNSINQGRTGANGDKGIHIGAAMPQRF